MDQLILVVIFGVIALFNWLIRQGAKSANRDKGSPPFTAGRFPRARPIQTADAGDDEERMRKFLEALGVPQNAPPPPKIVRPSPPRISAPVERELAPKRLVVVPKSVVPPLPPTVISPALVPEPQPTVGYESAAPPQSMEVPATTASLVATPGTLSLITGQRSSSIAGLQALLKSPSSIRTAIVLREILGPPKGLQQQPGGTFGPL